MFRKDIIDYVLESHDKVDIDLNARKPMETADPSRSLEKITREED